MAAPMVLDDEMEAAIAAAAMGVQLVLPGDQIQTETDFLRGHGTVKEGEDLVATVGGVVERVNKLITVRPLKARYSADVGDVVVGRITELTNKRWKVDVNGKQDAILMLSAINLPGGTLRRRTQADVLNMRNFFVEGDLISAEVQQVHGDGSMALHTRNLKYGKLQCGSFLAAPPALVKRCKSHFRKLDCGVTMILGKNGYIFLSVSTLEDEQARLASTEEHQAPTASPFAVSAEDRLKIARVRNCINALVDQFVAIFPKTVNETYNASLDHAPKDLLVPTVMEEITASAKLCVPRGNEV
mmetsp:Transcript_2360/g.8398  ORF Transcript_2360/g.8398 Transcript_2360/m.8398 type:complete len:300 (+) Transcript_2360:47-946(+)